jgi:hypothetical protein
MGGLVGMAWVALLLRQASPYGRYLVVANVERDDAADDFAAAAAVPPHGVHTYRQRRIGWTAGCGLLLVWLGFGVAAHGLDVALHVVAGKSGWLVLNSWTLRAGVLAITGLFQFSRLKYRCLDACRTPLSFIIRHWHGIAS